eukprot:TRINITY_DN4019_c0_g4_i2.p1 TRINITY_DN4019_c0_g4~~TRINITY_DN4019_c0_g4_i2.p1  ORF type:complete len:132 (-),score=37.39 TRINITY_DN4019_c0_g4_i2:191-586(-)
MSGEGKGIPASALSPEQLNALKERLEADLGTLAMSLNQLSVAHNRFVDSKDSLKTISAENEGNKILVPLTSSLYVPGKLVKTNAVLVDIGTGYYAEKDTKSAGEYFQRKLDMLKENIDKVQRVIDAKRDER